MGKSVKPTFAPRQDARADIFRHATLRQVAAQARRKTAGHLLAVAFAEGAELRAVGFAAQVVVLAFE
jgi:hypothetical protein